MFTGIITDLGEVASRDGGRFAIRCGYQPSTIAVGASIACDGVCLTATSVVPDPHGSLFTVDVSNETLSKTTLDAWTAGRAVNLERALKIGDELGGHMVSGHVDGLATIRTVSPDGESLRFRLETTPDLARFIAAKGSVALDGTSLTVNAAEAGEFTVNLIPHTLTATTWGRKKPGETVNLEVDMFARYVARLLEFRR
ncbi:MAG: riboflavin synthase [Hyphomicrobium sp.]|nr:riboflavin synthase [Hyphomicrobium sp.]